MTVNIPRRPEIRGAAIRAMVATLKSKPCMDCGGTFPGEAMDWDHRPGEHKLQDVGKLAGGRYGWDKVSTEIAKCDLVCSNCHRVRSKKRLNEGDEEPFIPFPKITRWFRETATVTEKIDGTNACIVITESGDVLPGSKARWLRPKLSKMGPNPDNFGFAAWVAENEEALFELGPGTHAGEWFGAGIQRKYGLDHKRLSLFNVDRFSGGLPQGMPDNVSLVPILYRGPVDTQAIQAVIDNLYATGSVAVPGWMKPEGVVITIGGARYKVSDNGDTHKGATP